MSLGVMRPFLVLLLSRDERAVPLWLDGKPEWDANQMRVRHHMVRIRDAALPRGLDAYSIGACKPEWYTLAPFPGVLNNSHSYAPQRQYPTLSNLDGSISRTRFGDLGYAATEMGTYTRT